MGACGGCGGGGFGESVALPQSRQSRLDSGFTPGQRLSLPSEKVFNVADAQRASEGSGEAESSANGDGAARGRASVGAAGKAWAEFQVGEVIFNSRSEPLEAAVQFDCAFEYSVEGADLARHPPEMVGLKLFVKDSNKKMLHKVVLVNQEGGLGAVHQSGRETPSFNITMEPGLSYTLVAAGRVAVAANDAGTPVAAEIEIKSLRIDVHAK